ncbi:hypothetical protein NDU88_005563 [Pleurodeles waltl]|uniref:Uncharacterized protein n=1 Tax=Pleurodeles waltl TaxID=8319 RepID=A0AAV7SM17_PLEWA|nr:hypothetical protein NDU88_005563 [Pleurodeles waltl]
MFIPFRQVKTRSKPFAPWINETLIIEKKHCKVLKSTCRKSYDTGAKALYLNALKAYQKLIGTTRAELFSSKMSNGKKHAKETYSIAISLSTPTMTKSADELNNRCNKSQIFYVEKINAIYAQFQTNATAGGEPIRECLHPIPFHVTAWK